MYYRAQPSLTLESQDPLQITRFKRSLRHFRTDYLGILDHLCFSKLDYIRPSFGYMLRMVFMKQTEVYLIFIGVKCRQPIDKDRLLLEASSLFVEFMVPPVSS